jgi:uncharacterized OB-fold protein
MTEKTVLPSIEGWFTSGDEPHLIGSQCRACEAYFFPKQDFFCRNPACRSTTFDDVELSRKGRIWSYTEHYYQPPEPYISGDEFKPYKIAAVELEKEKMVILGQVANSVSIDQLTTGQEVELVVETLYEEDGIERSVWKWKPLGA